MRKVSKGFFVCLVLVVLVVVGGCGSNSSREEAAFATSQLPDYGSTLSVFSIRAFLKNVSIENETGGKGTSSIFHIVVYHTKPTDGKPDGENKVAVWDDKRPPRQVDLEK